MDLYVSSVKAKGISIEAGVTAARSYILGAVAGQSLTFAPVVPEFLIEAARIDEGLKLRNALPAPRGDGSMTGSEYADMAISHRKKMGQEKHPVIKKDEHAKQWLDWRAYFAWRGLWASYELMEEHARKMEGHTVPAISPFEFDPEFTTEDAFEWGTFAQGGGKAPPRGTRFAREPNLPERFN